MSSQYELMQQVVDTYKIYTLSYHKNFVSVLSYIGAQDTRM